LQILFLFWVLYFLFVFRRTERKGFEQGAFGPHEPKGFSDSLFILGSLFSLRFLQEQERKDFFSQIII